MSGTLYGVGLGPGDPELLTIKALKTLQKVDRVFIPASRDGRSLAGEIVTYHLPEAKIEFLNFPMTEDREQLQLAWDTAVAKVGSYLTALSVAFVSLGDPFLYGSYLYLYRGIMKKYPEVKIVTIPGIPGMCAAAAGSDFFLTEENDRLLLITGKVEPLQFEEHCRSFETIVIYKPRTNFAELIRNFYKACPLGNGVIVERCGMAGERITVLSRDFYPATVDYFTIAILHTRS